MKFEIGDKIKCIRPYFGQMLHKDSIGVVLEHRSYCCKNAYTTHYLVKFDCYKIPHIYQLWLIHETCVKLESE